ncbi:MAG TPA: DEAD/DEAH box helicase family protein [Bryobacteraceae bacterium]|nr:DEAD/DEAH box helicase family protein [Bryobacteraceae bacterium]
MPLHELLSANSFLEFAFLRWVLEPAVTSEIAPFVTPQKEVVHAGRRYLLDYEIAGESRRYAIELDGFEFHGRRDAFSYDRLRQNDIQASGWVVVRFSYDSIRTDTARCVSQLQTLLLLDERLASFVVDNPVVERPSMEPDPFRSLSPSPVFQGSPRMVTSYFDTVRDKINRHTLRACQTEALGALANYYRGGGTRAACIMSVGAGKTALGVASCLAFARRRALVVTPGSVIRGTFDKAFDHETAGNALYTLPGGALIPGCKPPTVKTLDRDGDKPIKNVTRDQLLVADIIVTNFHSLGTGTEPDDILGKLKAEDVDFIVIDEAHIAASESYQRAFRHFAGARTLLMSACFQRLDGRPIDADIVYRYRLIDSIADGNAKNLRVQRFAPTPEQTTYEMVWPDGSRQEIVGRSAILELIHDERKLANITAKSHAPIRQIMTSVKLALDAQSELLYPVKPRVLFSALGERHAEQIAQIAEEHGIPCAYLHHSMTEGRIRSIRERYEQDSGDLRGIVQLKMLGQGYDFPPITIVVPMRPYGSFSEFYQFIGRGIRVISHPSLAGRVGPNQQFLDVVYHAELGLDDHIDTIYRENDMDPLTVHQIPESWRASNPTSALPGTGGNATAERPEAFILFERGAMQERIVHDDVRVEQRRQEREREALAQRYADYAQSTANPVSFEQYLELMRHMSE